MSCVGISRDEYAYFYATSQGAVSLNADPEFYESVYAKTSLGVSVASIVFMGILAGFFCRYQKLPSSTEEFITARGTQGLWLIAYSYFATSLGSWLLTLPASYAFLYSLYLPQLSFFFFLPNSSKKELVY
jgi:carbon starvation protein CstA